MKNNRGFTLVELLAVIVIMAIIIALAAPNINKQIKEGDKKQKDVLNQKIENAAHMYAGKYYADKIVNEEYIEFTLQSLVDDGLINLKGKCRDKLEAKISISDGSFDYRNIKASDCYAG